MENECYFVCSRGIIKSCDFHAKNLKSSSAENNIYLYSMLRNMFDGMSIYVCSDLLSFFIDKILTKITKSFVLVSGDSDMCVPREVMTENQFQRLIGTLQLKKWFIQNTQIQNHPKIIQLPIGLDYHTILNNPNHSWKSLNEGYLPREQELILENIKKQIKPFNERIHKIYVNFSSSSDRFKQRIQSVKEIPTNLLVIYKDFLPRTQNWKNMSSYAFVLSPFGIGMDCHRTWEALCLGCIPILCASNFKKLFEDLPVLNVDSWSNISTKLLEETIESFQKKTFNYDKLTLNYWKNAIMHNV
jgi:hypothetical protein